ncbi:MAG: hypothetical protein ACM3QW_03875 [Ignavibacteriales bacterium]
MGNGTNVANRVVEAYIGEYASGKSEIAINRALELLPHKMPITLVDLDFVEPFYTLRPLKEFLEEQGLTVIAWKTDEAFGLGEAGCMVKPAARWVMRRSGHVIMDVGYGVHGADSLNLVEGALDSSELKVLVVLNVARPMTSTVNDIVEYVRSLRRADGLINNTHLGDNTTIEYIVEGGRIIEEAGQKLGLPIVFTAIADTFKEQADQIGPGEVKIIHRYMPSAMW